MFGIELRVMAKVSKFYLETFKTLHEALLCILATRLYNKRYCFCWHCLKSAYSLVWIDFDNRLQLNTWPFVGTLLSCNRQAWPSPHQIVIWICFWFWDVFVKLNQNINKYWDSKPVTYRKESGWIRDKLNLFDVEYFVFWSLTLICLRRSKDIPCCCCAFLDIQATLLREAIL